MDLATWRAGRKNLNAVDREEIRRKEKLNDREEHRINRNFLFASLF